MQSFGRSFIFTKIVYLWACMYMCSLGISNFLEEISSLFHSIVFLYFFVLIIEEGFLISPCYSLELCIQMGISFLFSFALASLLRPLQTAILLFCISFPGDGLAPCLLYNVMNLHPQFIRHSVYQIQSLKSISHFHCKIFRDLIQVIPEWSSGFPYFLQFKSEFGNKEFMI